jgi:hypothetical protein
MYPVKLLYTEAESQVTNSKKGLAIQRVLDQIEQTRSKVSHSEDFVEQYSSYIPEPIIVLLQWEKKKRELLEAEGQNASKQIVDQTFSPLINKAFAKVVLQFTDTQMLNSKHLSVVDVQLPNLDSTSEAMIAIEAQYELRLPIPFFHHTLFLRKRSVERVWIGSS